MNRIENPQRIAAIVLAAGSSTRMGRPKMILPWGKTTVIGQVLDVLIEAGLDEILVVTGGSHQEVEKKISERSVQTVFNPVYAAGEMLSTLQCGLSALRDNIQAALIVLGDQPQIEAEVVRSVIAAWRTNPSNLVVPSFQMRRGHPWLVSRPLWRAILDLRPSDTPRDFLNSHAGEILYVPVETGSILQDLDTPEDYKRFNQGEGN